MWRIWIDTGGTFTDAVAVAPDGTTRRCKVLSTSALRGTAIARRGSTELEIGSDLDAPAALVEALRFRRLADGARLIGVRSYDPATRRIELEQALDGPFDPPAAFELVSDEEAPVLAARILTGVAPPLALPATQMRLATTLCTNALLERRGAPTALFVTRGFGDLLEIGTQQRPDLFALEVVKPAPLHQAVVEVPERIDAEGRVLEALDAEALAHESTQLVRRGVKAAAVALLHAWRNPTHELELADRLRAWGFEHVSCSSAMAPRIKILPRATTAVVDAYLAPRLAHYLDRVAGRAAGGSLLIMTSAGGLLDRPSFRAKDGLLSGPAAGAIGAAEAGRAAGFPRVLGFDMGGTSTDVSRHDGQLEYVFEHRVGDAQIAAPALAIETVAAGGGSVCWLDGPRLCVGPHSAGAAPGPACYGAGGPLTLTDADLLLGRLDQASFEIPIFVEPAAERLAELLAELARRTGEQVGPEAVLDGLLDVAAETMAGAMRRVSVRRGYDPQDYALVAFGGAGAQHACAVSDKLGVRRVVVPADAALLSAVGLGRAAVERFAERQVLAPLEQVEADLERAFGDLIAEAAATLSPAATAADPVTVQRRTLHLRFSGQEATLDVDWEPGTDVREAFCRRHELLFGHRPEGRAVEVEALRAIVGTSLEPAPEPLRRPRAHRPTADRRRRVWSDGQWREVPVFERASLRAGARMDGPLVVCERRTTTVVPDGWSARVDARGALILERRRAVGQATRPAAVRLELFTQRFTAIAGEMGERLERTAVSTNVKERLDFSCALLDPRGRLVASAPHVPVHLGALGLCVRRVAEAISMSPGDVVVTNHPAFGGSHLPDVTVITPVFSGRGPRAALEGYVASRAHHAEIGGTQPGSMPPAARCLAEEGVVIPPMHLVRGGRPCWDALREVLLGGPWPTRRLGDNLADLRAAVAANHAGALGLRALIQAHGSTTVRHYMAELERLAGERARQALQRIGNGTYRATEELDDGTPLVARIEIAAGRARIDFAGSGGVHPGNLNAPQAVVRSAVMYVVRLLIDEPLPLNEGLLADVSIETPEGLLDPPFPEDPALAPAVVGGNTETSQRVVDVLLRALGLAACSQGTMNNLLFGNGQFSYYETLGGGCGARPGREGASGVHSHMTNTRITDPEILEQRYPVRLLRFAIRAGSGGAGAYRGGAGLVREICFLEPVTVSVLTQHRRVQPYGMNGGEQGACGGQRIVRTTGEVLELGSIDGAEVGPGDTLIIETPGGGGWGAPGGDPIH